MVRGFAGETPTRLDQRTDYTTIKHRGRGFGPDEPQRNCSRVRPPAGWQFCPQVRRVAPASPWPCWGCGRRVASLQHSRAPPPGAPAGALARLCIARSRHCMPWVPSCTRCCCAQAEPPWLTAPAVEPTGASRAPAAVALCPPGPRVARCLRPRRRAGPWPGRASGPPVPPLQKSPLRAARASQDGDAPPAARRPARAPTASVQACRHRSRPCAHAGPAESAP
jgi:hypothetical protein